MEAKDTILPYLMPSDWSLHAESVAHRLEVPSDDPRIPWVALGHLSNREFDPLAGAASKPESEFDHLAERALANLHDRPASWQPVEGGGNMGGRTSMVACVDDDLSAERIMDMQFMIEAQKMLGTEILAVGIPRRRLLVAIDGRQPESSLTRFGAYNLGQYHSSETQPLTSLTFMMGDGEFAGVIQFAD